MLFDVFHEIKVAKVFKYFRYFVGDEHNFGKTVENNAPIKFSVLQNYTLILLFKRCRSNTFISLES